MITLIRDASAQASLRSLPAPRPAAKQKCTAQDGLLCDSAFQVQNSSRDLNPYKLYMMICVFVLHAPNLSSRCVPKTFSSIQQISNDELSRPKGIQRIKVLLVVFANDFLTFDRKQG